MTVEVIDPVTDYAELMETLFDFAAIRAMFKGGFRMAFDAMHAVTGPYAKEILESRLGAPKGTARNFVPLPDFGGHHPDPNLVHAKDLYDEMMAPDAPDFGAASDGDGDRNLIIGKDIFVTPSDSLAMLAANAHLAPGYNARAEGHRALHADQRRGRPRGREARRRHVRDADRLEVLRQSARRRHGDDLRRGKRRHRLRPCAREGRAVGGAAVAEHSGGAQGKRQGHRRRSIGPTYGRNYYSRHDYEEVDSDAANELVDELRARLPSLPGTKLRGLTVANADDFAYHDPVDGSVSKGPGHPRPVRRRLPLRHSACRAPALRARRCASMSSATSRSRPDLDTQEALADLIGAADEIAGIRSNTGRDRADCDHVRRRHPRVD